MGTTGGTTGTLATPVNDLNDLIPRLRLKIGDTDSTAYRYLDSWLLLALEGAVDELGKWWNYKYVITSTSTIARSTNTLLFTLDEATYGVIEPADRQIIVLMAAYIILEGSLESSAWNFVSWRDAEISFSNLESSRARNSTLERLWNELISLILPPTKKLAGSRKQHLQGFTDNTYEDDSMYS